MFSFGSTGSQVRYVVSSESAQMSALFKNMIETSPDETHISLSTVEQQHETIAGISYTLNTDRLLGYVFDYMNIWKDHVDDSDYVKEEPIHTGEITHILKPDDVKFIRKFLSETATANNYGDNYASNPIYRRKTDIAMLGELLCQVDEFLNIKCLSNKIYAYIAVLIWNTSAVDFADALTDDDFKQAQNSALVEWQENNPTRFGRFVKSHTTDGIVLAPRADNIDSDVSSSDDDNSSEPDADNSDSDNNSDGDAADADADDNSDDASDSD
jgi:hypothetical protein